MKMLTEPKDLKVVGTQFFLSHSQIIKMLFGVVSAVLKM